MSKLPQSVVGWENPLELMQRQTAAVQLVMLPQMILSQGSLVDVFKRTKDHNVDKLYGTYSGQKMAATSSLRTRVLGLTPSAFRSSKRVTVGGYFEGADCYCFETDDITNGDVLLEVGTQIKWIVSKLESLGSNSPRRVNRFRVSAVME